MLPPEDVQVESRKWHYIFRFRFMNGLTDVSMSVSVVCVRISTSTVGSMEFGSDAILTESVLVYMCCCNAFTVAQQHMHKATATTMTSASAHAMNNDGPLTLSMC